MPAAFIGAREPPTPALGALGVLGNILRDAGRRGEAEPLLAEALEARARRNVAEHPLTLGSASNRACLDARARVLWGGAALPL